MPLLGTYYFALAFFVLVVLALSRKQTQENSEKIRYGCVCAYLVLLIRSGGCSHIDCYFPNRSPTSKFSESRTMTGLDTHIQTLSLLHSFQYELYTIVVYVKSH